MYSSNLIKGRIAETIVSEMLREAGYFVYRFGYEGLLQSFAQRGLPMMRKDDIEADKVRTMPDFIVMTQDGDVSFVEVKYYSAQNFGLDIKRKVEKIARYWPETRLIFVRPKEPYFLISRVKDLVYKKKLYLLEKERFLRIDKDIILRYKELVKRYFEK